MDEIKIYQAFKDYELKVINFIYKIEILMIANEVAKSDKMDNPL